MSIQKFDLDGFKALLKFFLGQPGIRKEENVKLLAWLIDFEIRPYKDWKADHYGALGLAVLPNPDPIDLGPQENEKPTDEVKDEDITCTEIEEPPREEEQETKDEPVSLPQPFISAPVETAKPKVKSKFKNAIVLSVVIAMAGGGSYAFLDNINAQCMYWTGDQYQSVGCSVKVDHATVIALDKQKLVGLKKINRLDTITEKDLGKVWYVKIRQDSAEFYTDSGTYPLNNKKKLMPMTSYILNKYILHK
ncbi:hypothetical protein [Pedobacter sp. UC225_65]|uniref:hypothetical protein n=1 Tax=Pedobacter sp. UC225_65 TaxID=3350173 RepID=UPI00366D35B5